MNVRRKQLLGSALVAISLIAASCGGGAELKSRQRNGALQETIACAAGGIGPAGGVVLSVNGDQGVEVARESKLFSPPTFQEAVTAAKDYASALNVNGVGGWALPTTDVLTANAAALTRIFGVNVFWASDLSQYGSPAYWARGTMYGMSDIGYRLNTKPTAVFIRTFAETSEKCIAPTTTTTTTLPTCSQTETCVIGNNGPGGGTVVLATEVRDSVGVYIEYLEMTKGGWSGGNDPFTGMKSDAAKMITDYRGGGLSDWRSMTQDELSRVCRLQIPAPYTETNSCLSGFRFGGKDYGNRDDWLYWTAEKFSNTRNSPYDILNNRTDNLGELSPRVRPVRSWRVLKVSLVTTTSTTTTTTTVAPTTTWAAANTSLCSDLANCTVGQRGPGGGMIFRKEDQGGTPVYWEMAPSGWNTSTRDPFVAASEASTLVSAYRGGGFNDWKLPDAMSIESLCKFAAGRNPADKDPCVDNVDLKPEFGDGKSTRRGEFYWVGNKQTASQKTDFVSGVNLGDITGSAYVRPIRSYAYVAPTTTTTIPKTCKDGGKCAVGDISPAGNLIVDIQGSGASIDMTEIAPRDWAPDSLKVAGSGDDVRLLRSAAISAVAAYRGGSSSDWHLPSISEMRAAYVYFAKPHFTSDCRDDKSNAGQTITTELRKFTIGWNYWVIDPSQRNRYVAFDASSGAVYYDAHRYMTAWGYKDGENLVRIGVRPMRTVRYTGPEMAVTPYKFTPAKCEYTSPPTTTVTTLPATCRQGGLCQVGDVGPYGGIIIGVNTRVVDGPEYTEMSPSSRSDCNGTDIFVSCTGRAWNNGSYQSPFGQYPTVDELVAVSKSANLKNRLGMRNAGYWSSEFKRKSGIIYGDFTGNLNDLGRSLRIENFDVAIAVSMSRGTPYETSTAYFRGVVHWRCWLACVKP